MVHGHHHLTGDHATSMIDWPECRRPETMMAIRSSDPGTNRRLELIAVVLVPRVKITVPSLPSGFVARAELCAGLDAGAGAEVALVCALPGYGKTLCSRTGRS